MKDSAVVAPERKGGLKSGLVRAARHAPAQRSASASKTVRTQSVAPPDTSNHTLRELLKSLRNSTDIGEIRTCPRRSSESYFTSNSRMPKRANRRGGFYGAKTVAGIGR